MKFKSLLIALVVIFSLGLFVPATLLAADEEMMATDEATTQQEVGEISSFEMFWPVVAGRTKGDSVYFLKTLKEKVRGLLIFGKAQKADYLVFLSVKRVVESEKLLMSGKKDLANDTLAVAASNLILAKADSVAVLESGGGFGDMGPVMVERLENITKFTTWLSLKYPDNQENIMKVVDAAESMKAILQ